MKAPEKIYLHPDEDGEVFGKPWSSIPFNKHNVEYTRTDAFIERALGFLDGCIPDYIDLKHANVDTFMDVDNERFIKDFKNYMKGE